MYRSPTRPESPWSAEGIDRGLRQRTGDAAGPHNLLARVNRQVETSDARERRCEQPRTRVYFVDRVALTANQQLSVVRIEHDAVCAARARQIRVTGEAERPITDRAVTRVGRSDLIHVRAAGKCCAKERRGGGTRDRDRGCTRERYGNRNTYQILY